MQYLKHYWINVNTGQYAINENPVEKRHPEAEFPGLDVKIWMHDLDGIDVCLSTVPDTTEVLDVTVGNKKAVQKLTEDQFNSVQIPLQESQTLRQEALQETDETLKAEKEAAAEAKYQEAVAALHIL
jgi:hypothetical protein